MPNLVDINLLKQVTADAMLVYEAGCQSREMLDEGRQALDAAEGLLSQVKDLMLSEQTLVLDQMNEIRSRQALLENYVEIQRGYALLKDALYNLVQSASAASRWSDAYFAAHALVKLDAEYRGIGKEISSLEVMHNVGRAFKAKQFSDVINQIEKMMMNHQPVNEQLIDMLCESHFLLYLAEKRINKNLYFEKLTPNSIIQQYASNGYQRENEEETRKNWNKLRAIHEDVGNGDTLAAYYTVGTMKLKTKKNGIICRFWIDPKANFSSGQVIGILIKPKA